MASEFIEEMKSTQQIAKSALKMAAYDMKCFHNRKVHPPIKYQPGNLVLLEATNICTKRPSKKLNDKRYGPFQIIKKEGLTSYRLKLDKTWCNIHPVFHECLLHPYHSGEFPSQQTKPPPPPEIISGVEEAEIKYIIDSKHVGNTIHYLIHWKGFPREENEWIPVKELTNTQGAIKNFHRQNPDAPQLAIVIHRHAESNDPDCSCPLCLGIPPPTPSSLFTTNEFKHFHKKYNRLDNSLFDIP